MYIYHALISALSVHMIHINLNMIFYTHVEHSPTKTIYIKYYTTTKILLVVLQDTPSPPPFKAFVGWFCGFDVYK